MTMPLAGAASGTTVYVVVRSALYEDSRNVAVKSSNELAEEYIEIQPYADQLDYFIEAHQVDDELA